METSLLLPDSVKHAEVKIISADDLASFNIDYDSSSDTDLDLVEPLAGIVSSDAAWYE